jgi:hypothetical protein
VLRPSFYPPPVCATTHARAAQILIGTPGRVRGLIEEGALLVDAVRMFVLDEADVLLESTFRSEITWLHAATPTRKQVLAFSATYAPSVMRTVLSFMRSPQIVRLCGGEAARGDGAACGDSGDGTWGKRADRSNDARHGGALRRGSGSNVSVAAASSIPQPASSSPSLIGVTQYYFRAGVTSAPPGCVATGANFHLAFEIRLAVLMRLLERTAFHQAIVFCNVPGRGEAISKVCPRRPAAMMGIRVCHVIRLERVGRLVMRDERRESAPPPSNAISACVHWLNLVATGPKCPWMASGAHLWRPNSAHSPASYGCLPCVSRAHFGVHGPKVWGREHDRVCLLRLFTGRKS